MIEYIIQKLPNIIHEGKRKAENIIMKSGKPNVVTKEVVVPFKNDIGVLGGKVGEFIEKDWNNRFIYADNLLVMETLLKEGLKGKIDLIYIDPPFLTKANYKSKIDLKIKGEKVTINQFAYTDMWEKGLISYLKMIYPRLYIMRELLSDEGSIYVHLDWRVVHYVKILMDEIFGEENFLNEIIWSYKSGGVSKKYFSRKHDTILFYSKTKKYIFNPQKEKSYNRKFKPYRFKGVKEFEDELGWYTLVNAKDVWNIDMVGRTSNERVGYATQKPEKLLKKIILSSSKEGSIVADFFAGSGTTGIVAEKNNRKWILTDIGTSSALTIKKRLIDNKANQFLFQDMDENEKNENGKLTIEFIERKKKKEQEILIIKLKNYDLNIEKLAISDKDKKLVLEILKEDSLALIDYIEIDPDYDGKTPIFRWQDFRENGNYKINDYIKLNLFKKEGKRTVFLRVIDVFGNSNDIITYQ